jgi:hypothetical protein
MTGLIFTFTATNALASYTLYTYGFTANDSSATLTFALSGDPGPGHNFWLLDSVSANDTTSGTSLLTNGGFETGDFTGWTQYCNTVANCGTNGTSNYSGQITGSPCQSGSYCYMDRCSPGGHFDYLTQSFSTVIGDYYSISFYFRFYAVGGGWVTYVTLT